MLSSKLPKSYKLGADTISVFVSYNKELIAKELLGKYSRDLCIIELNNTDN